MTKPCASVSLDLDNKWSYMKTHGDEGWDSFPSYLDIVVPRVLEFLKQRDLKITFFVVGQDAAIEANRPALSALAADGHEIGNHSFHHEPWLHLYSQAQLAEEFDRAEAAIEAATGERTIGFRGPGFSCPQTVLEELAERGYEYDCSSFPTFLGPLARAYYFMTANLSQDQQQERKQLFGKFAEGFRTLTPHHLKTKNGPLVEVPVTTMPVFKVPIHLSYVQYLGRYSTWLAKTYFSASLVMCRIFGVEPSILLHPLDFMGAEDDGDLGFFPAMDASVAEKLELAGFVVDQLCTKFEVLTMREHVHRIRPRMKAAAI
jgi:hypothetical protein